VRDTRKKITVHGWGVPKEVTDHAYKRCKQERSAFDAAYVRCVLTDIIDHGKFSPFENTIRGRYELHDAIDALGTRLISAWNKEGLITKIEGTRKWKTKEGK